ncbi:dual specificity mitogen-activated protein kinase kinase 7-like isoform X5 [Pectinophora gossypiella]|uniref:dual specificity mitogen-activated protein kinase kinase 7-like isoform X5 n=1 Tax=Pectinophora gossypiella TaxID=13191 RepID=UPI00214EDA41|nr:dual specificity mitogen-activated protein kinase kinase 7-like isoform X5 [Pectinophora gossypiella]
MSNSSIEGRLKGLQERFENEMRIRRDSNIHNQGGLQASRPGSGRRPKPLFSNREIPAYPPRSPQATETESRMREVYKVSGKLNVDGVEYRSHIDELQHLGELGSGTCGHVVKMLHKPSAAVIAVKQMRRSGNSEETKRILMDLDVVVRSHDCPYIVRCLGCFVTDADVWICMELMASCFDKLLKRLGAPIPEEILGKVTVATVNALSYLKDTHGVIHRDVKPSNILLDERGNVKLCDFGISGRLVDSKAKTRSAGCAAYMAPERIDPPDPTRPDYDIRADVWSLGISLVELATGVFPYRDCQNDFEVLTRVIADDPPQLPDDTNFTPEFKSFVSQCLTKNYRQRPKYVKLLEHPFVVKSARSSVSVGAWYASLPISGQSTPSKAAAASPAPHAAGSPDSLEAPLTPQPVRNFVTSSQHWTPDQVTPTPSRTSRSPTFGQSSPQPVRNFVTSSQHWTPDQVTPTPSRAWWASSNASAGGSSSQPTSLELELGAASPFGRRRTLDVGASPPPPPARRVSADSRWRASPNSSGNTSPIVLQRFQHQSNQRRSRVDLHSTPRHRSLSKEHSTGRSPEPPPRMSRQHHMLGHEANGSIGSMELEPPALHERLHPPSPLLLHDRLQEGRSQSLTRAELRNGFRTEVAAPAPPHKHHHDDQGWLHSLAGLVKRRLSGYVKWHHVAARDRPAAHAQHGAALHHPHHARHRWNTSESWSVPASPLPPRAPPPRPAD